MTDIPCPICNRLNKDDAERCWYCQAVLHPEKQEGNDQADWLDGLRGKDTEPSQANDSVNPDEVPEWLARIRQREQADHSASTEPAQPGSGDAIDLLRSAAATNDDENTPAPLEPENAGNPATGGESDDADWLKKLESWQTDKPTQSEPQHPKQSNEHFQPESENNLGLPPQPQAAPGSEPDWLNEFKTDINAQQPLSENEPATQEPAKEAHEQNPSLQSETAHERESAQITDGISQNAEPVAENLTSKEEPPIKPVNPEGLVMPVASEPDWLNEFQALDIDKDMASQVLPQQPAMEPIKPPFSGRDMASWISKDLPAAPEENHSTPALTGIENTGTSPAGGENIEPAALPPWLQALRPGKEKTEQGSGDGSNSPLAGIEGVLQGDAVSQFYTRPQTYANTIKITPEQENHLQRLQNIAGETRWEAQEAAAAKSRPDRLLRILTSVLMIGVILFSIFSPTPALVAPTLYAQPVVKSYDILSALDPAKPVLIAADFDSSLYGELSISSEAVLKQLMQRNISIAYLSTSVVGSSLMQNLLGSFAASQSGYNLKVSTINLGYLAGGTVGLQALAQDPAAAMPLTTSLQPAWQNTPLEGIAKISDFSAVIVITENADTARYWIEQVKPAMAETPLLMIISAQAAPMLQPYYDSGQVDGYIAGESGSAAFENLSNVPGSANGHFGTYQFTLILAAILIFIGGLVSLITRTPSAERSGQVKK